MRLHRHDELVESMARTMYEHDADDAGWPVSWEGLDEMDEPHIKQKVYLRQATAALDALLYAAVKLGVAEIADVDGVARPYSIIALRLEASDDK